MQDLDIDTSITMTIKDIGIFFGTTFFIANDDNMSEKISILDKFLQSRIQNNVESEDRYELVSRFFVPILSSLHIEPIKYLIQMSKRLETMIEQESFLINDELLRMILNISQFHITPYSTMK